MYMYMYMYVCMYVWMYGGTQFSPFSKIELSFIRMISWPQPGMVFSGGARSGAPSDVGLQLESLLQLGQMLGDSFGGWKDGRSWHQKGPLKHENSSFSHGLAFLTCLKPVQNSSTRLHFGFCCAGGKTE